MWKITNPLGITQNWYTEEEYNALYEALHTIKNICNEVDGVYPLSQDIINFIDEVLE